MKTSSQPKYPFPITETETSDGRRLRSNRSRRRIIEALFELIAAGDMAPSAVSVAKRANVGMRTVFRHFEDMDSIYDEMTQELSAAVMPMIVAPYEAASWRGRLFECLDKCTELYEMVFPMKVSMSLRRFQSDFLAEQYARDTLYLRSVLKNILPKEICSNRELFGAIEMTLDFPTWRQLRQDQKRSTESAKNSIKLILEALIGDVDVN